MVLIYTDDSGTSWEKSDGFFKDGAYLIHTGILVDEVKYFHVERLFYDLFSSLLDIKDWRKVELHAHEIWNGRGSFSDISQNRRREYFNELTQLVAKFSLDIVVGIQQKNPRLRSENSFKKEAIKSQNAFLHGVEHILSRRRQTGVIVSDNGGFTPTMSDLLYKRNVWRYNPGADRRGVRLSTKYKYETLNCFVLDQIHHASSQDSLFIQFVDNIAYIVSRVFTYSYLYNFPGKGPVADLSKVPIDTSDFRFLAKDILVTSYDEQKKDINLDTLKFVNDQNGVNPGEYISNAYVRAISPYK